MKVKQKKKINVMQKIQTTTIRVKEDMTACDKNHYKKLLVPHLLLL
jgi:hypothetical protein